MISADPEHEPARCPHRRVREGNTAIVGRHEAHAIRQFGVCLDCGASVARETPRLPMGAWAVIVETDAMRRDRERARHRRSYAPE